MRPPAARPPRVAERLLAAVLGHGGRRDEILGDLLEEHTARARVGPRLLAAAWYWIHALRLAARFFIVRIREQLTAVRPDAAPRPLAATGDPIMRTLGLEIRHAFRAVVKRPAVSGAIVLTLALGLGANAAVFGVIDAVALRPFPIPDVDRIVMLVHTRDGDIDKQQTVSPADFLDFKAQSDVFEHLAAANWWDANLVGRDQPERVQGFRVSAGFFAIMGVQPSAGRFFVAGDETQGRHQVAVLGEGLWRRRFAADPSIVGRTVQIDGASYEIVGIAPPGFDFPMGSQVWSPLSFDAATAASRQRRYLTVLGRLAPGRTLDDAKSQVALIADRLAAKHPGTNRGYAARVYSLSQGMMDIGLGPILSMWQAAAVFVLLIACANVAGLLLARGAERQREMAVRLAIGASPWRVVRAMLLEGGILALVAVPAAVLVAALSMDLIRSAMPARIARFVAGWDTIDADGRVIAVTALLAAVAAFVSALVPALQAARPKLAESLKEGGRGTSGGTRVRLRRALVAGEIALALPLLVSCGLSALAVHRFTNGPLGFDVDRVLSMQLVLASQPYSTPTLRKQFAERAVEGMRALPGVQSADAINVPPAVGGNAGRPIEIDGRPNPDPANPPFVDYRVGTPGIFETLGVPLVRGRAFGTSDTAQTQPVVIVSESLARRYWPGEDPLGRRMKLADDWVTVVGICGDVVHNWFARRNYPTAYRPLAQAPTGTVALLLRTPNDPASLAPGARDVLRAIDPSQPVFDVMRLREMVNERALGLRYIAGILLALGGLALLLAVIGVYGVMSYLVTQQTHEIGVRMALGATGRDVLRLTIGQTGRLTAIGATLGILLSLALGRLIEAGLLGVASADSRVVVLFAALLIMSALAAGYVPARRAAAIEPMAALRE